MNIPIYPGSSSFIAYSASFSTGSISISPTPFGFYDNDPQFKLDADKVTTLVARRLGYPILNVELQDINFWTAFEESVTTYGNELYSYAVRDNLLTLEGVTTGSTINQALITPNLATVIRMSQQYASEAGVGGNVTYHKGFIPLSSSIQDYDLNTWASSSGISGSIEIKKIYYEGPPVLAGQMTSQNVSGSSSLGIIMNMPTNYLLMPLSLDLAIVQNLEMNNEIRRSNFTFEIINNKLRIFPIPDGSVDNLWFDYILENDRLNNSVVQTPTSITNPSNVPYTNPTYSFINSIGRQWIFEYTLVLCKEMLGYIRGKYDTVMIPGSELKMNQGDLISSATADKTALITRLREYLDDTSKQKLLERRSMESDFRNKEILNVPMTIYIG